MTIAIRRSLRLTLDLIWIALFRLFTDKLPREIAWRLPRNIRMWATIKSMSDATTGQYGNTVPSQLDIMTMMERAFPRCK